MHEMKLDMLSLFQQTLDLVCVVNKEGYFLKYNPAVSKKLGYTDKELLTIPVSEFIFPDDQPKTAFVRSKLLAGAPLVNFQNRYISKAGEVIWLEWTSVYIPEQEIVFAIAKDISIHKIRELALEANFDKCKLLAIHFKNNIDIEKSRLAGVLHEDLAQLATVIKMDLEIIKSFGNKHICSEEDRIDKAIFNTNELINKIRKITNRIGVDSYEQFGLKEAISGLCIEFSLMTGIACNFKIGVREGVVASELKMDIFRICQEVLLDILQGHKIQKVLIRLSSKQEKILLSFSFYGQGLKTSMLMGEAFSAIEGRVICLNGELSLKTTNLSKNIIIALPKSHFMEKYSLKSV